MEIDQFKVNIVYSDNISSSISSSSSLVWILDELDNSNYYDDGDDTDDKDDIMSDNEPIYYKQSTTW